MNKSNLKKISYELNIKLQGNVNAFIYAICNQYLKKHNIENKDKWLRKYLNFEEQIPESVTNILNENSQEFEDIKSISWLYQYFIAEEKSRVFDNLMKGIKVSKEDIPFATQLFTPDWIVKFLVDNSLGKILKEKKIEEIKFIDPCQGTGLILMYAFDIFLDAYLIQGYTKQDAINKILTKNLYGKDIDKTVCLITKLVLLLKAECFEEQVAENMHIECIENEFGSLIKTDEKFDVVCTNPPYMGKKNINKNLSDFLKKEYPDTKSELYAAFIDRCLSFIAENGYLAMITIHSWMFISSFANLRKKVLDDGTIIKMLHTGAATFDDLNSFNVLATSFVLKKQKLNIESEFIRLADYYNSTEKIDNLHNKENYYYLNQNRFFEIPNQPFIYWISESMRKAFKENKTLSEFIDARQGLATGNNKEFVKFWFEVPFEKIKQHAKSVEEFFESGKLYAPYNKGGIFRKWYGNLEYVIKFDKENYNKLLNSGNHLPSRKFYFQKGITWSLFGFENFGVRYKDYGYVFDVSGSSMFPEETNLYYIIGYLCSNVCFKFLSCLAPTVNFQVGNIASLPFKITNDIKVRNRIDELVKENIEICKEEWSFYETNIEFNWPFSKISNWKSEDSESASLNKLSVKSVELKNLDSKNITLKSEKQNNNKNSEKGKAYAGLIEQFEAFEEHYNELRNRLRKNEEELNLIYSEIFNVQDEIDFHVNDRDLSIKPFDKKEWVKAYLSYLVGVSFGRYDFSSGKTNYSKCKYEIDIESVIQFVKKTLSIQDIQYLERVLNTKIEKFYKKSFLKFHEKMYHGHPIYRFLNKGDSP